MVFDQWTGLLDWTTIVIFSSTPPKMPVSFCSWAVLGRGYSVHPLELFWGGAIVCTPWSSVGEGL